ncbi:hypothetical protein [Amphibacillus cookii]|uniref:hypothetical protein n=1 Tax=Amphibacillus cookii TaxID=767787 RepID=UPI0019596FC5|nr:hypothetical protein [Amphibacillus cookii]MBM7543011.1 hypothetical protein [Amphibacillus cookii]
MKKVTFIYSLIVTILSPSVIIASEVDLDQRFESIEYDFTIDDPNKEILEEIQSYIDQHLDEAFETMYLDWTEDDQSIYTFLFSEPLTEKDLAELFERSGDLSAQFVEVDYTQKDLEEKQLEIEAEGFEYSDFTINFVGTDIRNGMVNVGIVPYTEENADKLYQQFGDERVNVEQGDAVSILPMTVDQEEDETEIMPISAEETADQELNWFKSLWQTVVSWLPW